MVTEILGDKQTSCMYNIEAKVLVIACSKLLFLLGKLYKGIGVDLGYYTDTQLSPKGESTIIEICRCLNDLILVACFHTVSKNTLSATSNKFLHKPRRPQVSYLRSQLEGHCHSYSQNLQFGTKNHTFNDIILLELKLMCYRKGCHPPLSKFILLYLSGLPPFLPPLPTLTKIKQNNKGYREILKKNTN